MMISQPALLCLEATLHRLLGRADDDLQLATDSPPLRERDAIHAAAKYDVEAGIAPASVQAPAIIAEPDVPSVRQVDPGAPLTANERRARAAALRGLALSRGRRFAAARIAFAEAAVLDPMLDLTRTPAFWKLERAAHEAAIDAYVDSGRDRDAAVLRARVRSTYRPKAVPARQGATLVP